MQSTFHGNLVEDIRAIHLEADPRFSYSLILPRVIDADTRLVVSVHGSERDPIAAMTRFRDLALWHNAAILAPMFPRFADDTGDLLGYKILRWGGINYDEILMAMVEEAHNYYGVPRGKFALTGYSGGGQFVQRFALFHSARLLCLAVGAPGRVTLPTEDQMWWVGIGDTQAALGMRPDVDSLVQLPIQIVAGDLDIAPGYEVPVDSGIWRENRELAGKNRYERSCSLYRALVEAGAENTRLDIVAGEAHGSPGAFEAMRPFLANCLHASRLRTDPQS